MSSQGLSIKDIMDNVQVDDSHQLEPSENIKEASRNDCFYGVCKKSSVVGGRIVCGQFKSRQNRIFCFFLTTMLVALFFAIIIPLVLYKVADDSINSEVVIDSTSAKNYNIWRTNTEGKGAEDYHVHYDLYYFDLQNPVEVLTGQRPVVAEVGPYAYNEYFYRFDITWSDDGDTVTFYNQRYYVFDQARSGPCLTQFDNLTLPYSTVSGFQYILDKLPYNLTLIVGEIIDTVLDKSLQAIEGKITGLYDEVKANKTRGPRENEFVRIEEDLQNVNKSIIALYDQIYAFTAQSNPLDLFLKVMLCGTPSGISPFFKCTPGPAWFGWLKDPLLEQVSKVIASLQAKNPNLPVAWTTAVPGVTVNFTSPEEVRRRKMPETFKTGKKNPMQVGQYVKYNNMRSMYNCILPMKSQNLSAYEEGKQAPACAHFDENWNHSQAVAAGYIQPFKTEKANRIEGTDGNLFGRPVRTKKLQIFSYDIYRSGYMEYKKQVTDWYGVKLRRFSIQAKDMYNSTLNPENLDYFSYGISGVENLTQALNVPIFASFPHFLYGDPRLVEAVVGMRPDESAHNSEVDLEPQTGMIVRATKRIQVNYYMTSRYLPQAANNTLDTLNDLCAQLQLDIKLMNALDIPNNVTLNCTLDVATPLLQCLSAPSTWKMYGDEIYVPSGWVQEGIVMPKSSADELNDSLFFVDDLAAGVRFWCLIIAGFCFSAVVGMVWSARNDDMHSRDQAEKDYYRRSLAHVVGGSEPLIRSSESSSGRVPEV